MKNKKKLIYADDLKNLVNTDINRMYAFRLDGVGPLSRFLDQIDQQPAVDTVEVVHGHKIVRERHRGVARYIPCPCCGSAVPGNKPYTEKIEYCSVCSKKLDDTFQNYCPNCGAKMDLEC